MDYAEPVIKFGYLFRDIYMQIKENSILWYIYRTILRAHLVRRLITNRNDSL